MTLTLNVPVSDRNTKGIFKPERCILGTHDVEP